MSDNDIIDFPTSANQDDMPMPDETVPKVPTPEELQQKQQDSGEQLIQLIQKNRKVSHESLQRAFESLEEVIDSIRGKDPLLVKKDDNDKIYFSLEDVIRSVTKGLGACLTSMEANNSLLDMLIHDFGGLVQNISQTQKSMLIANSHTQVLLELLKEKEMVTESELKTTWERLVQEKQEQMKGPTSE